MQETSVRVHERFLETSLQALLFFRIVKVFSLHLLTCTLLETNMHSHAHAHTLKVLCSVSWDCTSSSHLSSHILCSLQGAVCVCVLACDYACVFQVTQLLTALKMQRTHVLAMWLDQFGEFKYMCWFLRFFQEKKKLESSGIIQQYSKWFPRRFESESYGYVKL